MTAVLVLAGAGRGLESAHAAEPSIETILGIAAPICHSGDASQSAPGAPADPVHHDCCDLCALFAPVTLAEAPDLIAPAGVEHFADHAVAIAWSPILARPRTPRLSQGPPAA